MIQVVNEFKINIQSNRGNISTNILRNWSWSYLKLGWNSKSLLSQLKFNFSMFGRKACRRGTQGTSAILELQATNWLGSSCLHQYPPNRETIFLKESIISHLCISLEQCHMNHDVQWVFIDVSIFDEGVNTVGVE